MTAFALGITTLILWSVGDVLTALSSRRSGDAQTALGVCVLGLGALSVATALGFPTVPPLADRPLACLTALVAGAFLLLGYRAFSRALLTGHPALTYALSSGFGVIVVLFSFFALGEPLSAERALCLGLVVLGVLFSSLQAGGSESAKQIRLALLSALFWGICYSLLKVSMKEIAWAQATLLLILPSVASAATELARNTISFRTDAASLALLMAAGLTVRSGDCFYNAGLGTSDTSVVAPIAGAYPAFASLLSTIFFREHLSAKQVLGVCVSIVGVVLLGMI